MRFFVCVGLMAIIACSKVPLASDSSAGGLAAGSKPRIYIALVCDSKITGGANQGVMQFNAINRKWSQGEGSVCIEGGRVVEMDRSIVRVYPVGEYENYLSMKCRNEVEFNGFLNVIPERGRLALVLNESVVGVFSYLDKNQLRGCCGYFPVDGLDSALNMCEYLVGAAGGAPVECANVCDANSAMVLPNVCAVSNAKRPYSYSIDRQEPGSKEPGHPQIQHSPTRPQD